MYKKKKKWLVDEIFFIIHTKYILIKLKIQKKMYT